MIQRVHLCSLLLLLTLAVVSYSDDADLVSPVPGYPSSFTSKVYSGYLDTSSSSRKLHYVLVESQKSGNDVPLTLWLNGGPGCSSMIGFLQEIGPFFLQEGVHYKAGDTLSENPYSWHKQSNLLFIETPAGVGYSVNSDSSFSYNDETTAEDTFSAVLNFFTKFSSHAKRPLWLAGESYAGKYIPDLAKRIDQYNQKGGSSVIDLKGVLVGNGVMSFTGGTLEQRTIQYMIDHDFIDPELLQYYRGSCLSDPASAGCRYFMTRYGQNIDEINPYNVYSYCYYNDSFVQPQSEIDVDGYVQNRQSQASILSNIIRNNGTYKKQTFNGPTCAYFDGMLQYFTAHLKDYHATTTKWDGPCSQAITGKYSISLRGSMEQYRYLLDRLDKYHVVLFNGDWDSVVPFSDTMQNIEKLNLQPTNIYKPFFAEGQHAGWIQIYGGLLFFRIKGGSHMVPQSKRAEAYELFKMVLESVGNFDQFVTQYQ